MPRQCQDSAKTVPRNAETRRRLALLPSPFSGSSLCWLAKRYSSYISNRAVFQDCLRTILRVHVKLPTCRAIAGQWQHKRNFQHRGNIQKASSTMLYASNLLRWLQRKRYQYEVTFSLYMLTPMEKFIFSTFPPVSVMEITDLRACQLLSLPRDFLSPIARLLAVVQCLILFLFPFRLALTACADVLL